MNKFSIIQKIRNKIKINKDSNIIIEDNTKIVKCNIYIKGAGNSLKIGKNVILRNCNIEIVGDNCSINIGQNCITIKRQ